MPNLPMREAGPRDFQYFYLRGFARSGTNWMENILNLHPRVLCCGEFDLGDVRVALDRIMDKHWWALVHKQSFRPQVRRRFEAFVRSVIFDHARQKGIRPATEWLGDRTPRTLQPLLGDGNRYFLIVRDGRDVLVSWTYHAFNLKLPQFANFPEMQKKALQFQADPKFFLNNPQQLLTDSGWVREIARWWADHCRNDFEFLDEVKKGNIPAKVLAVRYQDLHRDPETTRQAMYRHLDLEPAEALPLDSGHFKTSPGHDRDDPTLFYRKGQPGDWNNYFSEETSRWFLSEAEDVLQALENF